MDKYYDVIVNDLAQRDIGKNIAKFDYTLFPELNLSPGKIVGLNGKRITTATLSEPYLKDKGLKIIKIDGFTRRNCGVAKEEIVKLFIPKIEPAIGVVLAPIDMRLNVDDDFTDFCKNRLLERCLSKDDTTLIMMLGHAIPFKVVRVAPNNSQATGVQVTNKTKVIILNDPYELKQDTLIFGNDLKYLLRNEWLNSVSLRLKANKTTFKIVGTSIESENEENILAEADCMIAMNFTDVQILVNFYGSKGLIGSLPWLSMDVAGNLKVVYPDVQIPMYPPMTMQNSEIENQHSFIKRCFKTGLSKCPKEISISPKKVFIAMPFSTHHQELYKFAIRPALEDQEFEIWKADEKINNIDIMCKLCQAIQESAYVIADISEWNANVLFEMGLAYGMGKSVAILKDDKSNVPVDLKGLEYIPYDGIETLKRNLSSFLQITSKKV